MEKKLELYILYKNQTHREKKQQTNQFLTRKKNLRNFVLVKEQTIYLSYVL